MLYSSQDNATKHIPNQIYQNDDAYATLDDPHLSIDLAAESQGFNRLYRLRDPGFFLHNVWASQSGLDLD